MNWDYSVSGLWVRPWVSVLPQGDAYIVGSHFVVWGRETWAVKNLANAFREARGTIVARVGDGADSFALLEEQRVQIDAATEAALRAQGCRRVYDLRDVIVSRLTQQPVESLHDIEEQFGRDFFEPIGIDPVTIIWINGRAAIEETTEVHAEVEEYLRRARSSR